MVESMEELLETVPVFEGLSSEFLNTIAGCASNVRFDEGQTLFEEDEEANRFFIVRQGLVAVDMHVPGQGPVTILTVREGEVVGWSWLFAPYRWQFDARAVESTRALAFDARCLRGKCDEDPALGYELMRRFARVIVQRVQATRLQILDVYGHAHS